MKNDDICLLKRSFRTNSNSMSNQLRSFVQSAFRQGFFRQQNQNSIAENPPWFVRSGPSTFSLLYYFRHEWIKSFIRQSSGLSNFLWYDTIEPPKPSKGRFTIAWQSQCPQESLEKTFPLLFNDQNQCFYVRYLNPSKEITMIRLSDERRRFWKKFLSSRQQFECLSSKSNQFQISYRISDEHPLYQLETIEQRTNSTFDLILNLNQTLISLLIDSQLKNLHPLLSTFQIEIESDENTYEIALYLAKVLTFKHQLRVRHENGQNSTIPFRLILDEKSSKQGLCTLWSRDTHLTEEIHLKFVCQRLSDYFHALDDAL